MKRWSPLAVAVLVASTAIMACTDDRLPSAPRVSLEPQLLTQSPGEVSDPYALGDIVHGAIFTTTFDGGIVNENVRYGAKTEVYLDGGPRNPNSLAAGLPDGLYVFQITDPPGKVLLSMDPSRCRVVMIQGGVIKNTVDARHIPLLGASNDTWDDAEAKLNPVDNRCHVEEGPPDAPGSAAARHDINSDTELGKGTTVQMWPFHDTPNPGGVYKAWIIPLKAYVQNRTGGQLAPNYRDALNVQTKAITTTGPGRKVVIGFEPDLGFKNPSRKYVKTDNFKVRENPPFIRIVKHSDVNGDGLLDAGDTPYIGWPVSVVESVEDGVVGGDYETPTGAIGVPFNIPVTICERILEGWTFSYVYINGVKVEPPPTPSTDELQNPVVCVEVPGITSSTTVVIAFGNIPPEPEARITITPQNGINEVEDEHPLIGKVQIDPLGTDVWENAPDGTTITFALVPPSKAVFKDGISSCTTENDTGACSVAIISDDVETTTINASVTITVGGEELTRSTGGTAGPGGSGPARKYWVDAFIQIAEDDKNGITESHVFTATFTAVPGALGKEAVEFTWLAIAITAPTGFVKGVDYTESTDCFTAPAKGTTTLASCKTTINSNKAGTFEADATGRATFSKDFGPPEGLKSDQVERTTDGLTTTLPAVDAEYANSGPATKIYVEGTLVWEKRKDTHTGMLLGGAVFKAQRIKDRAGATVTAPLYENIADCLVAPCAAGLGTDQDAAAGKFKLVGLSLGTWRVTETSAPPGGYEFDPTPQETVLTLYTPDNLLEILVFINRIPALSLTPGYWKNHETEATLLLPQFLGQGPNGPYLVDIFSKATSVFDAMNCSSSGDLDAIGCLGGHLLASKLNVANGASVCIKSTIVDADAFLVSISYVGPSGSYKLNGPKRNTAIAIKDALDKYNNNNGCNAK